MFLVVLVLLTLQSPAYAKTSSGRCIYNYCNDYCYGNSVYCKNHDPGYRRTHVKCFQTGCTRYTDSGCGSYCSVHYNQRIGKKSYGTKGSYGSYGSKYNTSKINSSRSKNDPYDVYDYDEADDFADEWEDEFDDWDDAWDYYHDHH